MKTIMALLLSLFLITGFSYSDDILDERNEYRMYYLESDNFRLIKNEPDDSDEEFDFHNKKDLYPPNDSPNQGQLREKPDVDLNDTNANFQILHMCVWTADTAQSLQIGRKNHPEYNEWESRKIVQQILRQDKANAILIKAILVVFDDLWLTFPDTMSSSRVFFETYNACVKKSRKIKEEIEKDETIYM
jgi:hypothetical protein